MKDSDGTNVELTYCRIKLRLKDNLDINYHFYQIFHF